MLIWRYWQVDRSKIRCLSQFTNGRMSSTGPFSHARLRELYVEHAEAAQASVAMPAYTFALAATLLLEATLAASHGNIA
jgi:hypothetical protein